MHIARAAIERAAETVRRKQLPVTDAAVAQELSVSLYRLNKYLDGLVGLRAELEVESATKHIRSKCEKAIEKLKKANLMVTYRRIACLTKTAESTVRMWAIRQGKTTQSRVIMSEFDFRRRLLRIRLMRVIAHHNANCDNRANICYLAKRVGVLKTSLFRIARIDAEVRQILDSR
jgi:undecaprenyl pyrophosphate synthase